MIVLAVLLGFASISTDLFLPALPTMQRELGTTEGMLQFAISGYLLGFGFGQLFWGPISDRLGRKWPIAIGVVVFAIGSAGCALSTEASHIIGWRVVQALGASAGVALARAMVRDLYDRDDAARVLSTLMTVMAVAPLLGPSVGAQILAVSSWQMIFWTLVVIGALTLIGVMSLPESLPPDRREHESALATVAAYGSVLNNRQLLTYAAAIGFYYVAVFANIAGASFVYIVYFDLSPQTYGLVFASGVFGLMAANVVNARLVKTIGSDRMLVGGAAGAAMFGCALLVLALTGIGGVIAFFILQFLFGSMNGLILANGVAGALDSVKSRAGSASAVVGAIQYGSGMVGSMFVALLANGTPVPMSLAMAIGGLGCVLCAWYASKLSRPDASGRKI